MRNRHFSKKDIEMVSEMITSTSHYGNANQNQREGLPWQLSNKGFQTCTAQGLTLIPGWVTEIPHASQCGQKKEAKWLGHC